MLALSKKARVLPRNASLRSDMEKEEPKKKNFFLRHLFDFLLLATLTLGTASFFVVRAVQDASSIPSSGLVANILFEGKPMEILDFFLNNALSPVSRIETVILRGGSEMNMTESGMLTISNGNSTSCTELLFAILNSQKMNDTATNTK